MLCVKCKKVVTLTGTLNDAEKCFLPFHMPSLLSSTVSLLETLRDFLVTKTQTLILFLFITWSKWLPELLVKSV